MVLPFYCHISERKQLPRKDQKTDPTRIEFLARLRNEATQAALEMFPATTHIVNVESYYLPEAKLITKLVDSYRRIKQPCILGGTVWWRDYRTSPPINRFYDSWCFPDIAGMTYTIIPPHGIRQVSSVGSCFIFPREVWEEHRFVNPQPFPDAGIYYNWLCKKSALPVFADLGIRFFRDTTNSDIPSSPRWKTRVHNTIKKIMK